jgi:beta-glucosidase
MTGEPLYPFGFGLSYSRFSYRALRISARSAPAGSEITVSAEVANESDRDGHEVVQLYVIPPAGAGPARQLAGFEKAWIPARASKTLRFTLTPRQISTVGEDGTRSVLPGRYRISVGGAQPEARSAALGATPVLEADLEITGRPHPLPA